MKKLEQFLLREPVIKLFLYMLINALQTAVQIEHWGWKGAVGIVLAALVSWKTFMSDPKKVVGNE